MKRVLTRTFVGFLLILMAHTAFAGNVGVTVGGFTSPYIGKKKYSVVWPLIDIDTGFLFIRGDNAGFHIWRDSDQQLNAVVRYLPLYLKTSSNDNTQVQQLDRRRSTMLGGMSYQLTTPIGDFQAWFLGDMLNESDTVLGELEYAYTAQMNAQTFFSPYLGAIWVNKKHNRYYFGISSSESARSGLETYRPNDSLSYYAGLELSYYFNQHWAAQADYRFYLFRDIDASPIVKHGYSHVLMAGIVFNF